MRQRFIPPLLAIILSIIVIGFYARSLSFAFLGDDLGIVELLYKLSTQGALWKQVANDFGSTMFDFNGNYYRPLVVTAFVLDYILWGANPFGYHLTNLLLHLANTLLLYAIVLALVPRSVGWSRYLTAFSAAMFFALRPLMTEVAVWVSGRGDSLALLGMLVAVYGYLRANGRWNGWYAIAVGGFVFGLLSKEPAATLPAALVGLHLFGFVAPTYQERNPTVQARVLYAIRGLLPFVVITGAYFLWRHFLFGSFTAVYEIRDIDVNSAFWWNTKINALRYFLTPRVVPSVVTSIANYAMLGVLVSTMGVALRSHLSFRLFGFGVFWLLCAVLPSFPQLFINAVGEGERLFYLPTIPLAIMVTAALPTLSLLPTKPIERGVAIVSFGLLLIVFSINTSWQWQRLNEWEIVSNQLKSMTVAIREEAAIVPSGQIHLLLAPGNIQGVFFARSGQGALTKTPIQPYDVYGSIFVYASERPCQPPTVDLGLPITEVKCWNVQTSQFEPFDIASYDSTTAPIYWYLDPTLQPILEANRQD